MTSESSGRRRRAVVLGALALATIAGALIASADSAASLSHTFDEPHHLATGLEWWQRGNYRAWTENPPLPKIVTALAPHLLGMRLPAAGAGGADPLYANPTASWDVGLALLYDGDYQRNLRIARAGTLLFLALALALTYALAGGRRYPGAAFLATALVATYPPLLGHAGFATTDVAVVATTLLWLHTLDRWASDPSRGHATALGAAFALALLCKLTAPAVCGAAGLAWLAARRSLRGEWIAGGAPRARVLAGQAALAALAAFVVVWAGYASRSDASMTCRSAATLAGRCCRRRARDRRCSPGCAGCPSRRPSSGTGCYS